MALQEEGPKILEAKLSVGLAVVAQAMVAAEAAAVGDTQEEMVVGLPVGVALTIQEEVKSTKVESTKGMVV